MPHTTESQRAASPVRTVTVASVVALLAGVLVALLPGAADAATTTGTDDHRVVVVGTGGVTWDDVTPESTPGLWRAAEAGGVGNLVVRSVHETTCPADGWLALSAGKRAADYRGEGSEPCRVLTNPSEGEPTVVPGWPEYRSAVSAQSYSAVLGGLGDAAVAADLPTTAIGPGAMIALATSDGTVAGDAVPLPPGTVPVQPAGTLRTDVAAALDASRLVVVDAGSVRDVDTGSRSDVGTVPDVSGTAESTDLTAAAQHAADVATVDGHVSDVLDAVLADDPALERTTVVLASLSDPGLTSRMGVLAVLDGEDAPGTLTSRSTRQPGYVQTTDLLPTIAEPLGLDAALPRASLIGTAPTSDASGDPAADRTGALVDAEDHARAAEPLVAPFYAVYLALNLVLFSAVALTVSRRVGTVAARSHTSTASRRGPLAALDALVARSPARTLAVLRLAGVAIASVPVATVLANLLPWWRAGVPGLALAGLVVAWVALVTVAAVAGPWRRPVFGPAAVVSAVTAVVLAVDVATGARLQVSGVMGIQPMLAGRFYGFSNIAFAVFATATLVLAAAVADILVRRGQRRWAVVSVVVVGAVAVVINGSPSIGADFGGPPATVPAFCLLALLTAGVRVTWRKVLAVLAAAAAVVAVFAVVDWLRPAAQRTHLGAFVDDALDGELWGILLRKLGANLETLLNPLTVVAVVGIGLLVVVVGRPILDAARSSSPGTYGWLTHGVPMRQVTVAAPLLVPAIVSVAVAMVIGTLVNDSGIVILAIGLSVLAPLVTATCATWMLGLERERHERAHQTV